MVLVNSPTGKLLIRGSGSSRKREGDLDRRISSWFVRLSYNNQIITSSLVELTMLDKLSVTVILQLTPTSAMLTAVCHL